MNTMRFCQVSKSSIVKRINKRPNVRIKYNMKMILLQEVIIQLCTFVNFNFYKFSITTRVAVVFCVNFTLN
jgi:hypothetical protein